MCQKCIKKSKNLGKPRTVKTGLLNHMAHQWADEPQGLFIPLPIFRERAANIYIEARLEKIQKAKTKKRYNRRIDKHLKE